MRVYTVKSFVKVILSLLYSKSFVSDRSLDLSELSNTSNLSIGTIDDNELPVSGFGIKHSLIDDLSAKLNKFIKLDFELQVLLLVVAHKLKLDIEVAWRLLRHRYRVWRILLLSVWEGLLAHVAESCYVNLSEEHVRVAGLINSTHLNLASIIYDAHHEPLLHLPCGNLIAELLKEQLHDHIASFVDNKISILIDWRLLKIADDDLPTLLLTRKDHVCDMAECHTATHDED